MSHTRDLLFGLFLRAFPRHFRERYGASMRGDFEHEWHEKRARGLARLATFVVRTGWDMLASGIRERARRSPSTADPHRTRPLDGVVPEVRHALRGLRKSPAFTAVTVVTLGLGIGGATALFSVVDGVLLRPLPYPQPERLVQLWQVNGARFGGARFSEPNFRDVRERSRSFTAMSAYLDGPSPVTLPSGALRVRRAAVSDGFFDVLGTPMLLGRPFRPDESARGEPVMVVAEAFWRTYLGATTDLDSVHPRIGDRVFSIVGVLGTSLSFPEGTAIWTPRDPHPTGTRTGHNWRVVGRLRPGTEVDVAGGELSAIAADLEQEYRDETAMTDIMTVPLREQIVGTARRALLILLAASGFLLVVSCANVINLMLARGSARRTEIATRRALGAGRSRLAIHFLAEAGALSLTGGALGFVLARMGVPLLVASGSVELPRIQDVALDSRVGLFAVTVSFAVASVMGLLVSARVSEGGIGEGLASSTRSGSLDKRRARTSDLLTTLQVAMTLVLLVAAGLVSRSFLAAAAVDTGFRHDGALVVDAFLPQGDGYAVGRDAWRAATEARDGLLDVVRSTAGAAEVGLANGIPLRLRGSDGSFLIVDGPGQVTDFDEFRRLAEDPARLGYAIYRVANADYFRAMEIPLLSGRLFDERDGADSPPAAVISRALADTKWPDEDPIGKQIQFGNMDGDLRPFTIVGVVGDVRERLEAEPYPTFYGNAMQRPAALTSGFSLVLANGDAEALAPAIRTALHDARPDIPVELATLEDILSEPLAGRRFNLMLLGAFGSLATALALTGIYGVVSYLTAQRRREWAVRLALGASRIGVVGRVLRGGTVRVTIGIAIGATVAFAGTRLLAGLLFGVSPTDPWTFFAVVAFLFTVGLAACLVPALRAARVDPVVAMRD